jgi:hypothetical protein
MPKKAKSRNELFDTTPERIKRIRESAARRERNAKRDAFFKAMIEQADNQKQL